VVGSFDVFDTCVQALDRLLDAVEYEGEDLVDMADPLPGIVRAARALPDWVLDDWRYIHEFDPDLDTWQHKEWSTLHDISLRGQRRWRAGPYLRRIPWGNGCRAPKEALAALSVRNPNAS
jgi:hypothetical protein